MNYLTSAELERQAAENRVRAMQAHDQELGSWHLSVARTYDLLARQAAAWERTGNWPPRHGTRLDPIER
jgi:hypothetical protein